MSEQVKTKRMSHMWNFYTEIEDDPGYASCNYCNAKVYYKTSTSNMKSHIEKKHELLDILSDTDCNSTPQDQVKRGKRSVLWNFFTEIEEEPGIATCNTCMVRVSWKSSISNLKRHMKRKHPTMELISYKRFTEPDGEQGKKKRSSILWDFFTAIEDEPGYAICNMCKAKFSYKTSISNLKSHMDNKHPMAEFLQEKKPDITDVITERKPLTDSIDSVCIIKEEPGIEIHENLDEIIDIKEEFEEIPDTYSCNGTEIKIEELCSEEKVTISLTCSICSKVLSTEQSLKIHLWSHRDRMRYWCHICKKTLGSEFIYNRHTKLHESWKLTCDICGATMPSRTTLILHVRSHMSPQEEKHTKPIISCRICGETLRRIVDLESHFSESHAGEKPHSCAACEKTFTRYTAFRKHMRLIHKG